MKITIVLGAFFPVPTTMGGGVEKVWFALGPEFVQRGHEVVTISRKMPELSRDELIDGVRHLRVDGFNTPRSVVWLKVLDLYYSLRTMSILPQSDIVVTNTFWLPILLRNSKRGKVYVHAARYPKGQMRFYGKAARLQAPSHAVASAIAAEAPALAQGVAIIPNPAPRSTIAGEPPSIAQRQKIILFVGRVHPEKGLHLLVDAFAGGARTVFADWKLMIVGPVEEKSGGGGESYLASLKRSSAKANGSVIFAGAVFDPVALEQIFRSARLFVYPSLAERGESFGLAPLEAMTHGCAVLVSNLDCFHDFIRDRETGFIFDHRSSSNSETLRNKIIDLIANETLLACVAKSGHRKSGEYSLPRIADQFLSDFDSLVRNTDAARTNR
jgi:glycosyltransferase involved in cell wall biosynthesis